MNKTFLIDGHAAVSTDESNRVTIIQFMPDDEQKPVLERSFQSNGQM